MSFNSSYYLKLITKELSFYNEAKTDEEKEYWGRNIISRGYYTVLLHCKYVLNLTELERYSTDTHKQIILQVVNAQVKRFLEVYKKLREYADYYKSLKDDLKDEIFDATKLSKFIDNIGFLIQFDKIKLTKR
jgi:hypothetical protein